MIPPTVPALGSDAMPSTGFRKWAATILSTTQVTPNVILLALLFIYRLKRINPNVKGKAGSEFRLLTVALMLGNKCKLTVSLDLFLGKADFVQRQSLTTIHIRTRLGRKFQVFPSRRFILWRLNS